MNLLEGLKEYTQVVADTGDDDAIERFRPYEVTTNPSLVYKLLAQDKYHSLLEEAVERVSGRDGDIYSWTNHVMDELLVGIGQNILRRIPGRVSVEVDVRLSFDVDGTVARAEYLIGQFESLGVDRKRILVKIAATWEGVRAAERLEKNGIHCNLTLIFDLHQAVACAEAGVTLISPFVGRIYDWYVSKGQTIDEDPGVQSVRAIYNYYKKWGYPTEIMGASFRSVEQILGLAGCDRLTIAPSFLEALQTREGSVVRRLSPPEHVERNIAPALPEKDFRWQLNANVMATEKLCEGIRLFARDQEALGNLLVSGPSCGRA
jgi:transaldolase